ncbi:MULTISPECIES: ABC transporter ATP-binding protein [unclassified Meiothermus]|uniref:ABC transporter ATP-binding protein n=1 Tax=unclassified Meiothermus TaxID=370471 RepID=UPI000D7C2B4A|nr:MULTISPECIES: ABC transporter ATP-binding protein [unclassified Meiothermus]PZA05992.1 ABC transporter ATP-binding protein [Meiothermus sp. Pnk-1]RYM35259.1 ABC transporter ATP-binding protein [Meiothermus sp. PNK-Is4]
MAKAGLGLKLAVELAGVAVRFGGYTAVEGVDLEVGEGEFVAVVGPTGCGKSTLLNVVAGLLPPSAGEVRAFGLEVRGLNPQVGYLFQQDALLPWKTALDNVALPLVFRGTPLREARERARPWLAKVGLERFADRYPHQLSGGMKKRVGLAQVLIGGPRLLLMDEPFSALDVQTRHLMENELLRLWQEDRKSVIFITHDLEEAIALADRVVVMSAGPRSRPIGAFAIPLARPRDVAEIRLTESFLRIHQEIWGLLRGEVQKGYARED